MPNSLVAKSTAELTGDAIKHLTDDMVVLAEKIMSDRKTPDSLDPQSLTVLSELLSDCLWRFGEDQNIPPDDRKHLRLGDLGLSELHTLIATFPGAERADVRGPIFEILGHIQQNRRDVAVALFSGRLGGKESSGLDEELQEIAAVKMWDDGKASSVVSQPRLRVKDSKQVYTEVSERERGGDIYLGHARRMSIGGEFKLDNTDRFSRGDLDDFFLYGTQVAINKVRCKGVRLIRCMGSISRSKLNKESVVVANENLSIVETEIDGGEVSVEGPATFSKVYFYRTRIDLSGANTKNLEGRKCFQYCDFSGARMEEDDLCLVARSSENCIFNNHQLDILRASGIIPNGAVNGERIDSLKEQLTAKDRSFSKFGKTISSDVLDRSRQDIKSSTLLMYGTGNQGLDFPNVFPPVDPSNPEALSDRLAFFAVVCQFRAANKGVISFEKWLGFLHENQAVACRVLGLDFSYIQSLDLANEFFDANDKNGNLKVSTSIKEGVWDETVDLPGRYPSIPVLDNINFSSVRPLTTVGTLQIFQQYLKAIISVLEKYAMYHSSLSAHPGFSVPTLVKGTEWTIENCFHPNLMDSRDWSRKAPAFADITLNSLRINTDKSSIIAFTGLNTEAGKTFTQMGFVQSINQAQTGSPTPAKIKVPQDGQFDAILRLSNERARAGDEVSAAEERAATIGGFIDNVKQVAKKATAEKPVKVLLVFDEIMMGTTAPEAARLVECKLIDEMMNLDGVIATIMMISPDAKVTESLKDRFGDQMRILAPVNEAHKFIEVDSPVPCTPQVALRKANLGRFGERKAGDSWIKE